MGRMTSPLPPLPRPPCPIANATGLWEICVAVMDALEQRDGHDRNANEFFCAFMATKDGGDLASLIEHVVEVV